MSSKLSLNKEKKKKLLTAQTTYQWMDQIVCYLQTVMTYFPRAYLFSFILFWISFHRQLLCYTSTATDIPAASIASLKNRSSERKALLEGWSSEPLFNLFVDCKSNLTYVKQVNFVYVPKPTFCFSKNDGQRSLFGNVGKVYSPWVA